MRRLSFLTLFLSLILMGCEEQFDAQAPNQNPASSAAVVSEVQQWYNNIPEVKGGEAARKGKKKSSRLGVPVIHWDRVKVNDYGNGRYMVTAPVTSDVYAGRSIFQLVVLRDNDRINAFISEVIPDKAFFRRDENYKFSGQIKILSKTGRQLKTYKFENGQEVDFYKNATSTLRIANDEYGDYHILDEIVVQGTYNDYDDYYVGIGYTDWDDYWDDYYDNEWDDGWGSPGYAIDQYYEDEYYSGNTSSENSNNWSEDPDSQIVGHLCDNINFDKVGSSYTAEVVGLGLTAVNNFTQQVINADFGSGCISIPSFNTSNKYEASEIFTESYNQARKMTYYLLQTERLTPNSAAVRSKLKELIIEELKARRPGSLFTTGSCSGNITKTVADYGC